MGRFTQKLFFWRGKGPKRGKPTSQPLDSIPVAMSSTPAELGPTHPSIPVPVHTEVAHGQDENHDTTVLIRKDIQTVDDAAQREAHNGQKEDHDSAVAERIEEAFQMVGDTERRMKCPKVLGVPYVIDAAVDTVEETSEAVTKGIELVQPAYNSDMIQPIRDSVARKVVDSLPALLKLLDGVAQVHPFISIAISAFRVVVSLEQKHRENDSKIETLFKKMREMMEALLDLSKIKDKDQRGPDSQTIEARMQSLVNRTVKDVKECANACDTYGKQRLIAKVIYSSYWDETFQNYVKVFVDRHRDFASMLLIHICIVQDDVSRKVEEINRKLDVMLDNFSMPVSPSQLQLNLLVINKGGWNVVQNDDKALKELLNFQLVITEGQEKRHGLDDENNKSNRDGYELEVVKQELREHPMLSIENNLMEFERKFKIQEAQLEEVKQIVRETFQAVKSGAHDGIIESDIKMIWEAMRWPGQVKARHFVLALQEHYHQQIQSKHEASIGGFEPDEDEWALDWINLSKLQAISEAFDDDGSGFVTVAEVNQFTVSRVHPRNLQWRYYMTSPPVLKNCLGTEEPTIQITHTFLPGPGEEEWDEGSSLTGSSNTVVDM